MRIPLICALSASLVISACSRDETPPPAADATTPPAAASTAPAESPPAPERIFSEPELDQMVAPVALYPDPLLAQVLMGSTYPGDVADAAAWLAKNPDATGDAAVLKVADQPWDPSVQALVAFPQALAMLGQDPAWVQRLGDAFLAQPEDVMDAVQRLRRKAQDAGNLSSNEYQNVTTQPAAPAEPATVVVAGEPAPAQETVIIIEPSQPETVYVPSYNPTVVYGSWGYPSYPPPYYPTPYYYPGAAFVNGMMWGAGIAIGASLWGDLDWGGNDIDIDIDSYNSINRNNQINGGDRNWNHNAANRDGVPYRDKGNRERNGRQLDGAAGRDSFRGEDARRTEQRNQARNSMSDRGIRPAANNADARNQARTAQREGGRDAARDRAGATADRSAQRDRAGAASGRDAQRDRAGAASGRDAQRDRAAATAADRGQRDRAAAGDRAGGQDRSRQQAQSNARSRDTARQQQQRQQPRNNAFEGANRPSSSHQAQQRGRSSHQSASRPSGGRSGGHQVSRPSSSPSRSGGGGRRR